MSRADTISFGMRLPALWQRPWPSLRLEQPLLQPVATTPSPIAQLESSTQMKTRLLPVLLDPARTSWFTRVDVDAPLKLELTDAVSVAHQPSTEATARPYATYTVPALLRYSHEDTDVELSISPGSPCTGACLKLAGSF